MKNKTYDRLKIVVQVILPLLATFVTTIFEIWTIPYGAQISATIMAIDAFMGGILIKSSKDYHINSMKLEDDQIDEFQDNKGE